MEYDWFTLFSNRNRNYLPDYSHLHETWSAPVPEDRYGRLLAAVMAIPQH